jgi:Spy/CpxP family protein refolding chaperone
MKKLSVLLFAYLFLGITAAAFAAPPDAGEGGPRGAGREHGFHRFGPRLNLTQEQHQKIRELLNRYAAETHDLRYDVRIKRLEVAKLFTDPKTGEATLLAKGKELNGLLAKLRDKRLDMMVEWRKILTPEQIQTLGRVHFHRREWLGDEGVMGGIGR